MRMTAVDIYTVCMYVYISSAGVVLAARAGDARASLHAVERKEALSGNGGKYAFSVLKVECRNIDYRK